MKRSDVVKKISAFLFKSSNKIVKNGSHLQGIQFDVKNLQDIDNLSAEILKIVEELGMVPPIRERTQEEIDNPRYDGINMGKYIRDWAAE